MEVLLLLLHIYIPYNFYKRKVQLSVIRILLK